MPISRFFVCVPCATVVVVVATGLFLGWQRRRLVATTSRGEGVAKAKEEGDGDGIVVGVVVYALGHQSTTNPITPTTRAITQIACFRTLGTSSTGGSSGGSGGSSQGLHLSLRMRLSCSFVSDPSEQERGQDATAAASSASLSASLYDDKKGGGGDTSAVAVAAAARVVLRVA
mmetsp:Transcript_40209/g.81146  ORF Transcript_40209/g.81146 Transcript_40209/m.81146 type:complete len:173 (-) Transcript_40209:124-642(-)